MYSSELSPLFKFMFLIGVDQFKICFSSDSSEDITYEHFLKSNDTVLVLNTKSQMRHGFEISLSCEDLEKILEGEYSPMMIVSSSLFTSEFSKGLHKYLIFIFTGIILLNLQPLLQEIDGKTQENDFLNLLNNNIDLYSLNLDRNTRELRDDKGRVPLQDYANDILPRNLLFKEIMFYKKDLVISEKECHISNFTKWISNSEWDKNTGSLKKDEFLKEYLSSREVERSKIDFLEKLSSEKVKGWIREFLDKEQEFIELHNQMKQDLLASEFKDMKIGGRKFAELVETLPVFKLTVKSEKKEESRVIPFQESMDIYFRYRIAFWFSKDDFIEKEKNFKESKICCSARTAIFILDIIFFPLHCLLKLYKLAINKVNLNRPSSLNDVEITPQIIGPDLYF